MKTILFSILILCSVNAFSFNWKKVGENISGDSYYVDVDNIKKLNGLVYYWVLGDYLEPFDSETNSTISKYKVDFGEEKQTPLSDTYYSRPMDKGRIVSELTPDRIVYPKPNITAYVAMKFVCKYEYPHNWNKVSSSKGGEYFYYVDIANIKKHNEFIYYSELVDYLELENGDHSFISKYKVNCEEEKQTFWLL